MSVPVLTLDSDLGDLTLYGEEPAFDITRGSTSLVTAGFMADPSVGSTLLTNVPRDLDPSWTAGPFFGQLNPGVNARFNASWDTDYTILSGRVDDWPQGYAAGTYQSVDFHVTDVLTAYANADAVMTRPAERTGTRIAAVLAAIGYTGATSIATGMSFVPALKAETVSGLSHIADCVQVEFGELYVVPGGDEGTLTFRGRAEILELDTRSTISNASFVQSGGLNYSDLERASLPLWNQVVASYGTKGKQVVVRDEASIAAYTHGVPSTLPLSLPFVTASQARSYCRWMLLLYANPRQVFTKITIDPGEDLTPGVELNDLWLMCLALGLGDLIDVTLVPTVNDVLSDEPITAKAWIRGIQHNWATMPRTTDLYLQDAWWLDGLFYWDSSDLDGPDIYAL